jgi:hypothetical protein
MFTWLQTGILRLKKFKSIKRTKIKYVEFIVKTHVADESCIEELPIS